ncbi:MAG: hypothetical protein FK734_00830 [Asgard group archaeon]|nr:hypothetical protein [Asgard group archaeon]
MNFKFNYNKLLLRILLVGFFILTLTTTLVMRTNGISSKSNIKLVDSAEPEITQVTNTPDSPFESEIVTISCKIIDDSTFTAKVSYRINYGAWINETLLFDADDIYYAELASSFSAEDFIQYFITAIDDSPIHNTAIKDNYGMYYSFTVEELDDEGPVIDGVYFLPEQPMLGDTITIYCNITDELNSVLFARIFFRLDGGTWNYFAMHTEDDIVYSVVLAAFETSFLIEFYIMANDTAPSQNMAINDNSGQYFSFTVLENSENNAISTSVPIIVFSILSIILIKRKKS